MKKHVIFLVCSVLLLIGCKKEAGPAPYSFAGRVIDVTGEPIPSAKVLLSSYQSGNMIFGGGGYYRIAQATTDNDGKFSVGFNTYSTAEKLMIQVWADNCFPYINSNIFHGNIRDKKLLINPVVYKLATIKINFKNTQPVSPQDSFNVFQTNEMWLPSWNTFIERQFTGGTFNEGGFYIGDGIQGYELTRTKGDSYTIINWGSKKKGVITNTIDSVFIKSGTQGEFTIHY